MTGWQDVQVDVLENVSLKLFIERPHSLKLHEMTENKQLALRRPLCDIGHDEIGCRSRSHRSNNIEVGMMLLPICHGKT
jgi:hypothetical protein